ncbi:MAG: signal recognition particle protein [Pseudomonadota bacterium]
MINNIFDKLKNSGYLSEKDIDQTLREIKIALIEADVALPVIKNFMKYVKEQAVGQEIVKSVTPGQMVIKIVEDCLKDMLGSEAIELNLATKPPAVILMVGLQGSGKTTSTAKLAIHIQKKLNKTPFMASLDIYRPAAQKQLEILAKKNDINVLDIIEGQKPQAITKRALDEANKIGADVVLLDTAGRLHIDNNLMDELQEIKKISQPVETLLVADSLTGQDAVNIAKNFNEVIGVTGIILTRIDGDGRGGAALSMRQVANCPIKFLGVGEKIDQFEVFHPDRIASRILGMGDIVSLVEKASQVVDEKEAIKLSKKIKKGNFDFNDLASQLKQMKKMGGIGNIMGMIPGLGKVKDQLANANIDEKIFARQLAIIHSMTKKERTNPKLINSSRKKRIAGGAGVSIQEINKLIKQHKQMSLMMKKFGKMDKKALMRNGLGDFDKMLPKDFKM